MVKEESDTGYVLRNGKRYYQDEGGNLTLDNVSQEEADRREKRNIKTSSSSSDISTASPSDTSRNRISITSVPWRLVVLFCILCMMAGAFVYNRSHTSPAEQAISDYMSQAGEMKYHTDDENVMEANSEVLSADATSISENKDNYLLPDSICRYLEEKEISGYSHDEIQLMINEIYARHGREFRSQENREYFETMDWYEPVSGKTDEEIVREFNEYEKANVELLSEYL